MDIMNVLDGPKIPFDFLKNRPNMSHIGHITGVRVDFDAVFLTQRFGLRQRLDKAVKNRQMSP